MTDLQRINGIPVREVDDATKASVGWPYDFKNPPVSPRTYNTLADYEPTPLPRRERFWRWLGGVLLDVGCWCHGIDREDLYL